MRDRRVLPLRLLLALALLTCVGPSSFSQVQEVAGVAIVVADLDRSVTFYRDVLGFQQTGEHEAFGDDLERIHGLFGARARIARLTLGAEAIELVEFLAPRGLPIPADSRSNDGWFQHVAIVVSDMDRAYRHLREHRVEHASAGPQRLPDWNPNAGGIEAYYFKDPDHHVLEVIRFPPGKGDPRWQAPTTKLFLGIDHTAIVVRDTEASLAFWRDVMGLKQVGASENYGIEQERLNNVFGARLRITALRAPKGPGIEFLEYLAPGDGREYPEPFRANDLWSWQTRLRVADPASEAQKVRSARQRWVSAGAITPRDRALGVTSGALVRDPDGHALMLFN